MKMLKILLLITLGFIMLVIGIYLGYDTAAARAEAEKNTMSASVLETEVNRCVKILDDAGWINNHITVQF
jgi:hypothetical protein